MTPCDGVDGFYLRHCQRCASLELPAKKFDDDKADECGIDGNHKVCEREDIGDGESQAFAVRAVRAREFSHQEIRIIQEDYEPHFNYHAPNSSQPFHLSSPSMTHIRAVFARQPVTYQSFFRVGAFMNRRRDWRNKIPRFRRQTGIYVGAQCLDLGNTNLYGLRRPTQLSSDNRQRPYDLPVAAQMSVRSHR
jgi:hypothetical protein